ncbi:MAG: hypothetical protein P8011_10025 [Acidihalobacter sp.]|uniref:hypothetical protein n=1 Tax=Acidihalobacter sp. TaxID=1872108 RepID=UPI00307F697A
MTSGQSVAAHLSAPARLLPADPLVFREMVIDVVRAVQAQRPDGFLHLLYSPELADPLDLRDDIRREVGLLRREWASTYPQPDIDFARFLTLDCRRVAAYMCETDSALDDPLFEASITQAHAEAHLGVQAEPELGNDTPNFSPYAVCGWVATTQSAAELARRLQRCNRLGRLHHYHWLRWHNPVYHAALWPVLTSEQRRILLGDALWIAPGPLGRLHLYQADPQPADAAPLPLSFSLDKAQLERHRDAPAAVALARSWQAAEGDCPLPADALKRVLRHLDDARRLKLRGEDRQLYAGAMLRMAPGAERAAEWTSLLDRTVRGENKLRDGIAVLPERFWSGGTLDDAPFDTAPRNPPHD